MSSSSTMTSEIVWAYVNSADGFLSARVSFHEHTQKMPSLGVFTLFPHLLSISLFAVTIPSWRGIEHHQPPPTPPLELTLRGWDEPGG